MWNTAAQAEFYGYRAYFYCHLDDNDKALQDVDRYVQFDPRSADAHALRSTVLFAMARTEGSHHVPDADRINEAQDALQCAAELDPSNGAMKAALEAQISALDSGSFVLPPFCLWLS